MCTFQETPSGNEVTWMSPKWELQVRCQVNKLFKGTKTYLKNSSLLYLEITLWDFSHCFFSCVLKRCLQEGKAMAISNKRKKEILEIIERQV